MARSRSDRDSLPGVWYGYANVDIRDEEIKESVVICKSDHDWAITNQTSEDTLRADWEVKISITRQNDAGFSAERKILDSTDIDPGETARYPHYASNLTEDFPRQPGTYHVEAYSRADVFNGNDRLGEVDTGIARDSFVVD